MEGTGRRHYKSGGQSTDKFITIDWGKGPLGIVELEVSGCNFDLCPKKAIYNIPIISEDAHIAGQTIVCKILKKYIPFKIWCH
ncbi:MAG: hypothetical protein IPO92_18160 [Saprospiraceae bacterium]|nr:hypothetical protein [Saprospiraceae bacterium]